MVSLNAAAINLRRVPTPPQNDVDHGVYDRKFMLITISTLTVGLHLVW
jgi:hypothetical protein